MLPEQELNSTKVRKCANTGWEQPSTANHLVKSSTESRMKKSFPREKKLAANPFDSRTDSVAD
jgi:hypothetical protein